MCYNKESSIIAFIIGFFSSLYLITSRDKHINTIGFFFLFVSFIQFIEYLLWVESYKTCNKTNDVLTKILFIILTLQSIFIMFFSIKNNLFNNEYIKLYTIVATIIQILYIVYYIIVNKKQCTKGIYNQGLIWNFYNENIYTIWSILYMISFMILPFFWKSSLYKYIFILLSNVSFIIIYSNYFNMFESKWCYPASIMPLLFVVLDYFNTYY